MGADEAYIYLRDEYAAIRAALAREITALEQAGIRFQLGTLEILWLIAAMGPLALIAPAAQAYLSCFARSFKEAQSYTVVLVLPVVFLGVISTFYPLTNRAWILAIPFLGQYSLAAEVLAGRTPPSPLLIAVGLEALALTGVLLGLASRLFSAERIISES